MGENKQAGISLGIEKHMKLVILFASVPLTPLCAFRKTIMSGNFINFMSLGKSLALIGFESVVIAEPLWVSTQMKTTFCQCDEM